MDATELVRAAERVLSEQFGKEIRLRLQQVLKNGQGNIVVRVCSLLPIEGNASKFVIKAGAKSVRHAEEMLWNDWAALEFLGRFRLDPPVCPRLFGGDRSTPLIVMEDLGAHSVDPTELLEGNDSGSTEAALVSYMKCMGQLHNATRQKSAEFWTIRDSLGVRPDPKPLYHDPWSNCRQHDSTEVHQAIEEYNAIFRALDIGPHRGVDDEIEVVTSKIEECPEPYSALCQGDQNGPGGCLYLSSDVRLIDFGACGFRHALLEGMPHRLTWGCTKRIPTRLYSRLEKTYQSELAKGYRDAADDTLFRTAMIYAAARWNIFHTIWRVPDALQGDRPRGATSLRQQVIAWLSAFSDMTDEFSQLPALGSSARRLQSRLKALWPPETHTIPYYFAFHDE
jgi:hypothetical protein